ncbi:MAG: phosphoglycerate mutase (2,3-diphosphoglycerate-independent) [Armatimonadetes bacterium]|nr:phosphoglycerate mutase (2,3-diphosphoglycerate-independent) [Armatimonadota bacterium]
MLLVLFDGWGHRAVTLGNPLAEAETPNYDQLWEAYPHVLLQASGAAVGLSEGAVGSASAGYATIAAGRPVEQPALALHRAVDDASFRANPVLLRAARRAAGSKKVRLHLCGQVSDGGVVSSERHYFELLHLLRDAGVPGDRVFVHAILDGHDTPARSGLSYLARFAAEMLRTGVGRVATLMGRLYGMSTTGGWEHTERAYTALVRGSGRLVPSAIQAIQSGYSRGEDDFTLSPASVLGPDGLPLGALHDGDVLIFFNHREEGLERLIRALCEPGFQAFGRPQRPVTRGVCLTEYDCAAELGLEVAFPALDRPPALGQRLAAVGRRLGAVYESCMRAHAQHFTGGVPEPALARRVIPSPPVGDIVHRPEREAGSITAAAVELLEARQCDLVLADYVNADLAGHAGRRETVRAAVEALDAALPPLIRTARRVGGTVLLTAAHGNAEELALPSTTRPLPAHTANPVPLILINDRFKGLRLPADPDYSLADVVPTVFDLLALPPPGDMTGRSLLPDLRAADGAGSDDDLQPALLELTAMEALGMVLDTEISARDWYRVAADQAADPDSASLYRHFAREEEQRIRALEQRRLLLAGGAAAEPPPARPDFAPLPPDAALRPLQVYELVLREEEETYRLLTELAARNLDPQATAVLEQLANEELEFYGRLQRLCEAEEIRVLAALPTAGS